MVIQYALWNQVILGFDSRRKDDIIELAAQLDVELTLIDLDELIGLVGPERAYDLMNDALMERSRVSLDELTVAAGDAAAKLKEFGESLALVEEAKVTPRFHNARKRVICKPEYCQSRKKP